jgi:hypothetical protein
MKLERRSPPGKYEVLMKTRINRYLAILILVLSIGVLVAWISNGVNNWLSVRWLQYQVKRNVNPVELQQWATNLLAQHRGDYYEDFEGTNVPAGVAKVQRYPAVRIHGPGNVIVFSDIKGGPFLVVGSPSDPTPASENIFPWRPGMYFVR